MMGESDFNELLGSEETFQNMIYYDVQMEKNKDELNKRPLKSILKKSVSIDISKNQVKEFYDVDLNSPKEVKLDVAPPPIPKMPPPPIPQKQVIDDKEVQDDDEKIVEIKKLKDKFNPKRTKNALIASFVTMVIQLLISLSCILATKDTFTHVSVSILLVGWIMFSTTIIYSKKNYLKKKFNYEEIKSLDQRAAYNYLTDTIIYFKRIRNIALLSIAFIIFTSAVTLGSIIFNLKIGGCPSGVFSSFVGLTLAGQIIFVCIFANFLASNITLYILQKNSEVMYNYFSIINYKIMYNMIKEQSPFKK